jgi:hypothetical protein
VYTYGERATGGQVRACWPISVQQERPIPHDLTRGEADQYIYAAAAGPPITFEEAATLAAALMEMHAIPVPYAMTLRAARAGRANEEEGSA